MDPLEHVQVPEFGNVQDVEYDWEKSVYGDLMEEVPDDIPTPLNKTVTGSATLLC
jgi:hypothetical protein